VISGLEFAVWFAGGVGLVMESAVGERSAKALVEEEEEERDVNAFGGQAVSVAAAIALKQAVSSELAEVIAELVESVMLGRDLEGGDDCLVNLVGRPSADSTAVVQQNLKQPDDPRVMDLDAGKTDGADGDGQSDPLEERKIHVNVEALGLEAGETVGDGLEPFANGFQVIESFLQWEVVKVVGD
jgi:hypothetical protein